MESEKIKDKIVSYLEDKMKLQEESCYFILLSLLRQYEDQINGSEDLEDEDDGFGEEEHTDLAEFCKKIEYKLHLTLRGMNLSALTVRYYHLRSLVIVLNVCVCFMVSLSSHRLSIDVLNTIRL